MEIKNAQQLFSWYDPLGSATEKGHFNCKWRSPFFEISSKMDPKPNFANFL